jgi:hypothetical protein
MIQKQSNTRLSGSAHNHQEQKRRDRSGIQQRAFFFLREVHSESVSPNTAVNSGFYCDVLRRLRENVRRKRTKLWRNHNWLLHHDDAPAHTSLKTTEFGTNNNMVIVLHPPYSTDLAPCDFALFPKLKMKRRTTF